MLRAGNLRERVALYKRGPSVPDAMGQVAINWVLQATVWAELVPLRAVEVFAAQQITAQTTLKFRIRHRPGIDATWRLVWHGEPYDITGVQPFGAVREGLELICVQGVKDGR